MYCPQQIAHTIRQSDNLYQLAKHYRTTVQTILAQNPQIDPYNLQIGARIIICPGSVIAETGPVLPAGPNAEKEIALMKNMRLVWSQHVYWTRMLIISIAERLKDLDAVTARLLENPNDLAIIYANYYQAEVAESIAELFTEHLKIGAALVTALRDGRNQDARTLDRQWYDNAASIAQRLTEVNPHYNRQEVQEMMYRHLDLTKQEAAQRLKGNYAADIMTFNMAEQEMLAMADIFTKGLMMQFPDQFS